MEIRWNKNAVSRGSPETNAILRPSSVMNSVPSEQMGPSVSTATGTKVTALGKSAYICGSSHPRQTRPQPQPHAPSCSDATRPVNRTPWHPRQDSGPQTTGSWLARQGVDHPSLSSPSVPRRMERRLCQAPGVWCRWLRCGQPAYQPPTDMRVRELHDRSQWRHMNSDAQSKGHNQGAIRPPLWLTRCPAWGHKKRLAAPWANHLNVVLIQPTVWPCQLDSCCGRPRRFYDIYINIYIYIYIYIYIIYKHGTM